MKAEEPRQRLLREIFARLRATCSNLRLIGRLARIYCLRTRKRLQAEVCSVLTSQSRRVIAVIVARTLRRMRVGSKEVSRAGVRPCASFEKADIRVTYVTNRSFSIGST